MPDHGRTSPSPVARRTFLLGGLAAGAATLLPPASASAAGFAVGAHVRAAYEAAGGVTAFGAPAAGETTLTVDGQVTYGQAFARGRAWFAAGVGKADLPASARVRLQAGANFRPVLGVRDVWRTDDLDKATALDKRVVWGLGIRTMIAFNTGSDPVIPAVTNHAYVIDSGSAYRGYVTLAGNRASIGRTLSLIAATPTPVLVHCWAGKDRTGWVSELLQRLAGVPESVRDADYLATRTYSGQQVELVWLQSARDQLTTSYGTLDRFLVTGCGMTTSAVTALRSRLAR